jgi:hypothetical protein
VEGTAYLLQAVCACLRNRQVNWPQDALTAQDWDELVRLAGQQQVLPMVIQGCYRSPAFLNRSEEMRSRLLRKNRFQVAGQTVRSAALAALWSELRQAGFTPVIMKGAACRSVYSMPGVRLSSDEDVLVPPEQFAACAAFLQERQLRQVCRR